MSPLFTLPFAAGAALFYVSASWIMKSWGASPYLVLAPAIVVTLAAGAWLETELPRWSRLGYVFVLAIIMAFLFAFGLMGEKFALREIAGAMVVFVGIALLGLPTARRVE